MFEKVKKWFINDPRTTGGQSYHVYVGAISKGYLIPEQKKQLEEFIRDLQTKIVALSGDHSNTSSGSQFKRKKMTSPKSIILDKNKINIINSIKHGTPYSHIAKEQGVSIGTFDKWRLRHQIK